jgi:hypothetical protein
MDWAYRSYGFYRSYAFDGRQLAAALQAARDDSAADHSVECMLSNEAVRASMMPAMRSTVAASFAALRTSDFFAITAGRLKDKPEHL